MAMTAEIREEINSNNYVLLVRIGRQEFIEQISQQDLAHQVSGLLAEKIATCLWERIEPKILQAITEEFTNV